MLDVSIPTQKGRDHSFMGKVQFYKLLMKGVHTWKTARGRRFHCIDKHAKKSTE